MAKKRTDKMRAAAMLKTALPVVLPRNAVIERAPDEHRDSCLVCDTELPPGPDFCSPECERASLTRAASRITAGLLYGNFTRRRKAEQSL